MKAEQVRMMDAKMAEKVFRAFFDTKANQQG